MDYVRGMVSVIMSNYNTPEEYLRSAIDSILRQTYKDIEFIIVDDCSTDDSCSVIESYTDNRIRVIRNEHNLGITKSLNLALGIAKGEFVARMDADDISLPLRLERQVRYLQDHEDIIVCGTWVELFGDGASKYVQRYSKKVIPVREIFQINLLFGNHTNLIHPTAMFRHQMLDDNHIRYNENYQYAQDYRMWVDCSRIGECANLPEVLFKYRIHDKAVSSDKKADQKDCTRRIMEEQLSWLHLELLERWEEIHYGLLTGRKPYDLEYYEWIKKIIASNREYKVYSQEILENFLWKKWAETIYFELARNKRNFGVLLKLPAKYYPELVRLWKLRNDKEKHSRKLGGEAIQEADEISDSQK